VALVILLFVRNLRIVYMKAIFVELPAFERYRDQYLDDAGFRDFQNELIKNPTAGDVIAGTGGLRKIRFGDLPPKERRLIARLLQSEIKARVV